MSERNKAQNPEPAPPPVSYAFWDVPETSLKVIYSLLLFHEIDFVVNEGYRKIPHGGIEVGGLLFGTIDDESIRIEAFRPINCEHASGPTLTFSERDLTELKNQIAQSASDSELQKLRPVGWFLAHTRGPLELTETEAKQFDQFFPEPLRVTVLVKPERFQPTRFGFLVRTPDGKVPRDASTNAVILPLPGRSQKSGQLMPSLAAPLADSSPKRAVQKEASDRTKALADYALDEIGDQPAQLKAGQPTPLDTSTVGPDNEREAHPSSDAALPGSLPPELRTPAESAARRQLSRDRARVIEQAYPSRQPQSAAIRPPAFPPLPPDVALPVATAYDRYASARETSLPPTQDETESVLNARSVTALALAALLGCLVGYIAYLQLPAPVIPIDVRSVNQTIVVSWPPNETRRAVYAAIRLNDGPPVPLSEEEKKAGQVSLTEAKDFKVEVLARNWIRDSRGIVRYLHSANGSGQVVPSNSPTLP